jgi:hypothetical protein
MELSHDCDEIAGAAKLLHDFPQAFSADRIESLGQIDKGHEEVAVLLLALFLKLAGSKYHVNGATFSTKAALTFWEESLLKV